MKAYSVDWKMMIELTNDEASSLAESPIIGIIRARNFKGDTRESKLEVKVGKTADEVIFADLVTEPPNVYVDNVKEFYVTMNEKAYQTLMQNGKVIERLHNNLSCKIEIYRV